MLGSMMNLFFPNTASTKQGVGLSQFDSQFDAMNQSLSGMSSAHKQHQRKTQFQQWMEKPPIEPVSALRSPASVQGPTPVQNPFMIHPPTASTGQPNPGLLNTHALPKDYGINKPLERAMFLGYHNDKPLLCGQNLFITC